MTDETHTWLVAIAMFSIPVTGMTDVTPSWSGGTLLLHMAT